MEALQISNGAATIPATASLFTSFVSFIDRGERTTQTYLTNLRQFASWLSLNNITRPTRADIILYREYLTGHCKPNTVSQYLRTVCQFFRWTASEGLYPNIAENIHAPKVRHDTHRKEALQAADVLAIENSIKANASLKAEQAAGQAKDTAGRVDRATEQGKRLYAMYLLAVNAGMRTVELERANIKDIEVRNGSAVIYIWGKGHTEADSKKPLAPAVYAAIKEYIDSRTDKPTGSSPLFVSTGNRSKGQRIAARTISQMLKKAMKEAGFDSERITAHSLRHTAGTSTMELTGNIYTTQQYMRHSNPATTEIYLHNDTEKQEATIAQQLYNYYHGTQESDNRQRLNLLLDSMSQEQIEQLAKVAAAMSR